jgi:hypothetical protein
MVIVIVDAGDLAASSPADSSTPAGMES